MDKRIEKIMTKRNIILLVIVFLCITTSFILYGKNKSKVFKDEYMKDIFVDEEEDVYKNENSIEVTTKSEVASSNQEKSVANTKNKNIFVEIKGEVVKPDVYEISEGSIIRDLINKAGGLTSEANIDKINRADKLKANQLIIIPNKNDSLNVGSNLGTGDISDSVQANEDEVININTATLEELQKISGIGEVKAKGIIQYREKNGGFNSIEEIKNIDGIGEKTFEKMKDQIKV
jgi:competence protein ComEA